MDSLSHEKDFKWSLALGIFNNKEVCGENNSENYENKFRCCYYILVYIIKSL